MGISSECKKYHALLSTQCRCTREFSFFVWRVRPSERQMEIMGSHDFHLCRFAGYTGAGTSTVHFPLVLLQKKMATNKQRPPPFAGLKRPASSAEPPAKEQKHADASRASDAATPVGTPAPEKVLQPFNIPPLILHNMQDREYAIHNIPSIRAALVRDRNILHALQETDRLGTTATLVLGDYFTRELLVPTTTHVVRIGRESPDKMARFISAPPAHEHNLRVFACVFTVDTAQYLATLSLCSSKGLSYVGFETTNEILEYCAQPPHNLSVSVGNDADPLKALLKACPRARGIFLAILCMLASTNVMKDAHSATFDDDIGGWMYSIHMDLRRFLTSGDGVMIPSLPPKCLAVTPASNAPLQPLFSVDDPNIFPGDDWCA